MANGQLTDAQYDVVYGINPQEYLSNFSDCIVAGDKNLDNIAVDVQKYFSTAQTAVDEFLSSVDGAMDAVRAAKEEAVRALKEKYDPGYTHWWEED